MNINDTASLLRETDKGVEMAIFSFDQLLEHIKNPAMKKIVTESKNDHIRLQNENADIMKALSISEEKLGPMAKGMAWMETSWKTGMEDSDRVAAGIIVKGCNTGIENLYKYINEYADCEPAAAETAKKLISIEERLGKSLRIYL